MKNRNLYVSVLLILALSACGETPPPSRLDDLSSHIIRAATTQEQGHKILEIDLSHTSVFSESNYFFLAAAEMLSILKGLQTWFPDTPADRVRFRLSVPLVDQYGNSRQEPVIEMRFDRADIRRINFDSGEFTQWNLLNLARARALAPAGDSIIRSYCQDETNAGYAHAFCVSSAR